MSKIKKPCTNPGKSTGDNVFSTTQSENQYTECKDRVVVVYNVHQGAVH